jgi:nucleoside-diphosphate-sugar epimerase
LKVLVTGSNGFIGSTLCDQLAGADIDFVRAVRNPLPGAVAVGSISGETDWSEALQDVDAVVHLAARVHVLNENAPGSEAEFEKVNVDGTTNLARQAAKAGVSRFVFISSIGVHGQSSGEVPFSADDLLEPHNQYSQSKYRAELALKKVCAETGMEAVVVRPPLVYGPGDGANFLRLMKWVDSGIPLPLGALKNLRSPVFVGNLCDLIFRCLKNPAAAEQVFLVSDDRDVSTPDLLRMVASNMGKPARLFPVPKSILRLAGWVLGRSGDITRLCGSLQLDISHTKETLGWTPPFTLEAGIEKTVQAYTKGAV